VSDVAPDWRNDVRMFEWSNFFPTDLYFADLSSGEKVLMSLALCLYYTEDTRQITNYPKLLLLDEIDAPLHPSMCRLYLDVLIRTVVETHKICVIATTHSPSTVAIAPEESIYVIEPNKVGLHKTTKARALSILTDGVPTLSISFDGRRQVFVESPNDAKIFDTIMQIFKGRIQSERSLEFGSYPLFLSLLPSDLQPIIDRVQASVLRRPAKSDVSCDYLGGFSLNIDAAYLSMDDHKLDAAVCAAFTPVRSAKDGSSIFGNSLIDRKVDRRLRCIRFLKELGQLFRGDQEGFCNLLPA